MVYFNFYCIIPDFFVFIDSYLCTLLKYYSFYLSICYIYGLILLFFLLFSLSFFDYRMFSIFFFPFLEPISRYTYLPTTAIRTAWIPCWTEKSIEIGKYKHVWNTKKTWININNIYRPICQQYLIYRCSFRNCCIYEVVYLGGSGMSFYCLFLFCLFFLSFDSFLIYTAFFIFYDSPLFAYLFLFDYFLSFLYFLMSSGIFGSFGILNLGIDSVNKHMQ